MSDACLKVCGMKGEKKLSHRHRIGDIMMR